MRRPGCLVTILLVNTRRKIGSETTDNLSEDNPVKNVYIPCQRSRAHTYPSLLLCFSLINILKHNIYLYLFFA